MLMILAINHSVSICNLRILRVFEPGSNSSQHQQSLTR
jgi:hypothetical protein